MSEVKRALFVPKGSGGYVCRVLIEQKGKICSVRIPNTTLEDFAELMGLDSEREIEFPFCIGDVDVRQLNGDGIELSRNYKVLSFEESVKFMETKRLFKKVI